MRRLLALLFCLAFAPPAWSDEAAESPTLVLDSGGHTAMVSKVLFTPDGRELISVSFDKTVRVWDVASGDVLRVLRPPAGKGPEGMLYAAALSPDGRTLAVAGYGFTGEPKLVYLISMSNGQVERTLTGHTDSITCLAYSPDGKRLASGSLDKTARVWDAATGPCELVLEGHTEHVYGVAFSPDGRRLVTASSDKTGRVWDAETGWAEAVLTGHTGELNCVAWRPNGTVIATGSWDHTVRLWSPEGKAYRSFEALGNHVTSLTFTPDSRGLLATLGGAPGELDGVILDVASLKERVRFSGHTSTVMAGAVHPDGSLAATAGGGDNEVYLWRTADAATAHRLAGKGRLVWAAGWSPDGRAVAWGNTYRSGGDNLFGPVERTFDPSALELAPATGVAFARARASRGSVTLKKVDATTLSVERAGAAAVTIKTADPYNRIRSYALLPDDRVAVGCEYGLDLYDARTGNFVREFLGHTGVVWAVAPSPDGRLLLSASSDQTARVWSPDRDEPVLSLFAAGDDWVAWTPEGYYAASPGGERLMGWQVGHGRERMAEFFPADKFRKTFYRPDVIKLVLSTGSTDRALEFADRAKGRVTEKVSVSEVLPPAVEVTSPTRSGKTVESPKLVVKAVARSRGEYAVKSLRLMLDGRPYQGQGGVKTVESPKPGEVAMSWNVELEPGTHKVAVQAETDRSQGVSDPVEVTYAPEQEVVLPSLYVLAVGVSEYPGDLRLHYAAKDAEAIERAFKATGGSLFKKVEVKRLTDAGAKRIDILAGLVWLRRQMTQKDVGVVFFSGHGQLDSEKALYLLPVDVDTDNLLGTGVPDVQLKKALAGMPGRVILMLDACHAGAVEGGGKGKETLTDDLVRDLVTDEFGVIVMASSTGREVSRENNAKRQGNFTLALVEGLTGAADYNKDRVVYLSELDNYVSDRVKELSKGEQHPVTAKPSSVRSFPLARP